AGRTDAALEELVGFFVNTLVLRTDVSGDPSFRELLGRVRNWDLSAYAHQDLPFERLVEALNPTRSLGRHPLFQVMLAFQNTDHATLRLPGLDASIEPVVTHTSKYDLAFNISEQRDREGREAGLEGLLEYSTDLFDRETAAGLVSRLVRLLRSVVSDPSQSVGRIELLDAEERSRLLSGWNATDRAVPGGTVPDLFEAQMRRTPEAVALEHGGEVVSYAELNRRANRLAHVLIGRGIGPESVVGIALPRSVSMVVSVLGVLKAGAAYLPLDPEYPADRLGY
ncbi:condensation domain-containing protein, partial [Inquilinus sp. 2KB_23]|uniref:condensation domain-containing protein n=1 Tax=Inquilinus sp. 2KB_23 TaxID=3232979 RepID=UPI003F91E60A